MKFMGSVIKAKCPCGYVSGDLFEGCGMAGPETCRNLARCDHCQEIVLIRSSSVRPRCPKCRHKVQVITIDNQRTFDSKPEKFECPQCRKTSMRLKEVGLWD